MVIHGVDLFGLDRRTREHLFEQGNRAPDVVARGQLGYDAAVFFMHRHLRMQCVRQQAALGIVEREAGFVAGGFDAED